VYHQNCGNLDTRTNAPDVRGSSEIYWVT